MLPPVNYLVPLLFLAIIAIIDIKTYAATRADIGIPSAFTTGSMIISYLLNPSPGIVVMAFIMGLLLLELSIYAGLPDLKAFMVGAIVMPSIASVAFFAVIVCIVGIGYKYVLIRAKSVPKNKGRVPFIPSMLISYMIAMVVITL